MVRKIGFIERVLLEKRFDLGIIRQCEMWNGMRRGGKLRRMFFWNLSFRYIVTKRIPVYSNRDRFTVKGWASFCSLFFSIIIDLSASSNRKLVQEEFQNFHSTRYLSFEERKFYYWSNEQEFLIRLRKIRKPIYFCYTELLLSLSKDETKSSNDT